MLLALYEVKFNKLEFHSGESTIQTPQVLSVRVCVKINEENPSNCGSLHRTPIKPKPTVDILFHFSKHSNPQPNTRTATQKFARQAPHNRVYIVARFKPLLEVVLE